MNLSPKQHQTHGDENTDITIEENAEEQSRVQKIKKLTEKLKQCEQERSEYLAGWQRAKADFINTRKKNEKHQNELLRHAEALLIKTLLPIGDSFESAYKIGDNMNDEVSNRWRQGIESIAQQFWQVLHRHGVERITTKGETFDPALHEAIAVIPVATPEEDLAIMREEQAGYRFGDTVLRPARVQIGKFNKFPPETPREEKRETDI